MGGRDALRLRLGRQHPVRLMLKHNGKMTLEGLAANLSVTGSAFYVRPNGTRFPSRGERYTTCRILLPGNESLYCQATIIHGRFDAETGYTMMGIRFDGLEAMDEARLQRFITQVQLKPRKLARLDETDGIGPMHAARMETRKSRPTPDMGMLPRLREKVWGRIVEATVKLALFSARVQGRMPLFLRRAPLGS